MDLTSLLISLKIFSHTSFNTIESSKRVGGDETVVVWIGAHSSLEDEGISVKVMLLTAVWFICSELEEVEGWSHMIESSSSESDSIIIVLEGAATFRGCATKLESSEKKE